MKTKWQGFWNLQLGFSSPPFPPVTNISCSSHCDHIVFIITQHWSHSFRMCVYEKSRIATCFRAVMLIFLLTLKLTS
ncbi:MAG: hypothetical protein K2Q24_17205 [Chitinophagaceae bacterium]|nr:hypothetical protein [Chitinophagaceae bacterium]